MTQERNATLTGYLNDMLAVERDIAQAVSGQLKDERIDRHPGLREILDDVVKSSRARIESWERISAQGGGSLGAAVKGTIMAVAGTLAGIYGKLREHPVSRMVRDDLIALDVAVTGYGMLLTLARILDDKECITFAELSMLGCPPLVVRLDDILPLVIAAEVAEDGIVADPAAVELAQNAIHQVWVHTPRP